MKILLITLLATLLLGGCSDENETHEKTTAESRTEHREGDDHGHDKKVEDEHGDDHKGDNHEEEAGIVKLSPQQLQTAGIKVTSLELREVGAMIRAPGEVKLNEYQTVKVTSRIAAQVVARHARLGDNVEKGQGLLTLSSVEMAEAQGQLLLADKEWKRVKELGRKVVSERRYITTQVDYEKAYANAKAFGMSETEIKALLAQKRSADGSFKLVAQQAGRILHDKFIIGERVEAGYELMVIADESVMWVEARVNPAIAGQIDIGNTAEVMLDEQRIPAKVVQLHHTLDETTRTSAVRLEVGNVNDQLHAGMFVTALITTRNQAQALQVPEAAVLRSADGDWQVMVEQDEAGEFKAVEVEVKSVSDGKVIIEGIKPGARVVTQGAFFVQSELAKGGFDIHNH
ncbi:MAG: efflux RND transporter periplasmic adaptor subunit [Gammaproteobacteria bacterium]|nr:efflux RND transporter periplasmic adaptor subunit [Gammaproteobacteria bacterium]